MTLEELIAKLAAIKADMEKLIAEGLESREATDKFDALETEAKQVRANIKRIEGFQAEADKDKESLGRVVKPSAVRRIEVHDNEQDDPTAGFTGLGEFARAVRASHPSIGGVVDDRLKVLGAPPSNTMKETGTNDGYTVPPEFKDKIIELVFNEPGLLNRVDGEPTDSNSVQFLADETTPWGSTGIQAYWSGEKVQFTASELETKMQEMKLHKLHAFVAATDELLADSPRLNARLSKGASRAIAWKANEAILFGTGAGQPLGFDKAASAVTVAKESGQAAATIVAKNVAKMFSRSMNPGGAVWLANQDTLPEFLTMVLGDKPIWTPPATGFANAPGGFLFGRPVEFSNHCDTLGTAGDLMLVDPMGYYLSQKSGGIKFNTSIHLYFDYDLMAFKWTFRIGGQPYLSAAVSPNKGTATRSHYVKLATRA